MVAKNMTIADWRWMIPIQYIGKSNNYRKKCSVVFLTKININKNITVM